MEQAHDRPARPGASTTASPAPATARRWCSSHGFLVDATLWSDVPERLGEEGHHTFAPTWPLGGAHDGDEAGRRPVACGAWPGWCCRSSRRSTSPTSSWSGQLTPAARSASSCSTRTTPRRIGRRGCLTNCDAFEACSPPVPVRPGSSTGPDARAGQPARRRRPIRVPIQPMRLAAAAQQAAPAYGVGCADVAGCPTDDAARSPWVTPVTVWSRRAGRTRRLRRPSPAFRSSVGLSGLGRPPRRDVRDPAAAVSTGRSLLLLVRRPPTRSSRSGSAGVWRRRSRTPAWSSSPARAPSSPSTSPARLAEEIAGSPVGMS